MKGFDDKQTPTHSTAIIPGTATTAIVEVSVKLKILHHLPSVGASAFVGGCGDFK